MVLELTLKHLNALTAVTEQQHQKILALQNGEAGARARTHTHAHAQRPGMYSPALVCSCSAGDRSMKSSIHADLDAFHSGFQACAKEVLQYLGQVDSWTAREQSCARLVSHLHQVLEQVQTSAACEADTQRGHKADGQANCVPVIQRTQGGELTENDTDTDSGYGGDSSADKSDGRDKEADGGAARGARALKIKQEFGDDRAAKKPKLGGPSSGPDVALMTSLVGQHAPICMPFYFINPSSAAPYLPLFDKSNLEKFMYPAAAAAAAAAALASPFPWLYPAHASFPGLSAHFGASPQPKEPGSPDGDAAHEAERGSPEEREESPTSEGDGDVGDGSRETDARSPRDQFSSCPPS